MTWKSLKRARKVGRYTVHHYATAKGYISRKASEPVITPYKGMFGAGYVVAWPRYDTTRFITIAYYIKG